MPLIVKQTKEYPWPCEVYPNRTIIIYGGTHPDILERTSPGVFKHTSIITRTLRREDVGILIPEEDIQEK